MRNEKLYIRLLVIVEVVWIALLTCALIAMIQVITVRADEPKTIINGQYVIDITEAPPINDLSSALETIDVYVPDSDDDCPVNEAVPLSTELQEYIWTRCKKATADYEKYYAFILGCIQHESTFRAKATHHNSNGTTDRGIMQINSCNIGKMRRAGLIASAEDLFDPYKCIDCGFWLMNQYIDKFGVTEDAYYAYNTGKEHGGSNRNSRKVMGYMSEWNAVLFSR